MFGGTGEVGGHSYLSVPHLNSGIKVMLTTHRPQKLSDGKNGEISPDLGSYFLKSIRAKELFLAAASCICVIACLGSRSVSRDGRSETLVMKISLAHDDSKCLGDCIKHAVIKLENTNI